MNFQFLIMATAPILILWGLMFLTLEISHRPGHQARDTEE